MLSCWYWSLAAEVVTSVAAAESAWSLDAETREIYSVTYASEIIVSDNIFGLIIFYYSRATFLT